MHAEIAADPVPRAMVEIETALPERLAREGIELRTADALREDAASEMAIMPLSTRVKRSVISALGLPTAMVRVMSVVPSTYWPPESIR